jgi:hypothetical protein
VLPEVAAVSSGAILRGEIDPFKSGLIPRPPDHPPIYCCGGNRFSSPSFQQRKNAQRLPTLFRALQDQQV